MQMWLPSMWICDPLGETPPLSSPLHPCSWQELQAAFSHAFPKSRYVDSISLTSHNGEFVQQETQHYLNPSVALPLFEICWLDCRALPSVSFRDEQKVNSGARLWGSQDLASLCRCPLSQNVFIGRLSPPCLRKPFSPSGCVTVLRML